MYYRYLVSSTGTDYKQKVFATRKEAENDMRSYCRKNNIKIECTECDRHERKYSNHAGVRFYINRVQ